MKNLAHLVVGAVLTLWMSFTTAVELDILQDATCPDAELFGPRLMTDICWDCMFPIRLMGAQIGSGPVPDEASDAMVHVCYDNLGVGHLCIPMGMWSPARLVEVVRLPYCSPTLSGTFLKSSVRLLGGKPTKPSVGMDTSEKNFMHYHYYSFPLFFMLDLLINQKCAPDGFTDLDLMYMSEIDVTWVEDVLAVFTHPEVLLYANPLAMAACGADCMSASANNPMNSLHWCAGCWGGIYPMTGNVTEYRSPPRVAGLLTARAIAAQHRRGLAWRTVGTDALCGGQIWPIIPKDQYRFQQFYPVAEASSSRTPTEQSCQRTATGVNCQSAGSNTCCHSIGQNQFLWGEHRNIPAIGEDFVNVIFRYTDCCL